MNSRSFAHLIPTVHGMSSDDRTEPDAYAEHPEESVFPGAGERVSDEDRQRALEELCRECAVVVVVGGRDSNNTRELVATSRRLGAIAHHVESPDEIDPAWFGGVETVGVTAGTSTLDESVQAVVERLQTIARPCNLFTRLRETVAHG